MPWTDEMVESLKKMWDEGLSTGEIGRRLGVSKNSIVGKVHRLQLVARPSPIKRKDPSAVEDKNKTKAKQKTEPKTTKSAEKKAEPTPKAKPVVKPVAETKPTAKKAEPVSTAPAPKAPKEEPEQFINVSIPVVHPQKKPGDKITVTDLDNHTCRWPIGDPKDENFHFCGASVRIGQTYCEEHAAIAYVKNIKK